MATLNEIYLTDLVNDVLASGNTGYNKLLSSALYANYRNVETISATKELTDDDYQIQLITPSSSDQTVELPPEAITNHLFWIVCSSGASYSVVVKDDSGTTALATLTAGEAGLFVSDGSQWLTVSGGGGRSEYAVATETINLDNTMTTAEIQAAIDGSNHLVAPGKTLVFQFADGTYTLNTALTFSGFFGGGHVRIKGNSSDGASSTQSVVLDTSATTPSNVIFLNNNNVYVRVENIEINVSTSSAENYGILANESNAYVYLFRCVAVGNSTANGRGIYVNCPSYVKESYFSNIKTGMFVANGINFVSDNNQSFGTIPVYGIWNFAGILFTIGANQPSGSTSNVLVNTGVEY